MRILLDHCVDRRLARYFPEHTVMTAARMGWDELRNGKLLIAAAEHFDVMLTVDRNLQYQQNPATLPIAVVVLVAKSNRLAELIPLVPAVERTLDGLKPRTIVEVSRDVG
jgi:predicted nuclease of predicted toxin-antitoxin system